MRGREGAIEKEGGREDVAERQADRPAAKQRTQAKQTWGASEDDNSASPFELGWPPD